MSFFDNDGRGPCGAPSGGTWFLLSHQVIKDQDHTIKHAVEKEYSCIISNLVRSKLTNLKMSTKIFIHIYVILYEKTDGQTDKQTDGQTNRRMDVRTEEHVRLFIHPYVRPSVRLSVCLSVHTIAPSMSK